MFLFFVVVVVVGGGGGGGVCVCVCVCVCNLHNLLLISLRTTVKSAYQNVHIGP